jgi:hypothetical protein
MHQPGCLSEKLTAMMTPGDSFSIASGRINKSIDAYLVSEAHSGIKNMHDICTAIGRRLNGEVM